MKRTAPVMTRFSWHVVRFARGTVPRALVRRMMGTLVLSLTLAVAACSQAGAGDQAEAGSQAGGGAGQAALTPLDYIEIEQLAIRYAYGLDTGAEDGYMYADVFTPDGEFVGRQVPLTQGREALARVARSVRKANPMYVRHFITNHVIEPAPEGATGTVYLMVVDCEEGQPASIYIGGQYKDLYVKTANGWRIKRRDARGMGPPRNPGL